MHLFDGVRYFLSPSLPPSRAVELGHVLDNNGAIQVNSLNDTTLTHFITNTNRFERWQEVTAREDAGEISVVTDKWVDRSMLLGKLQSPSYYSADPAMIFSGVVACAAELPTSDLEVLSAGISALGGQWRTGLTKDVTHLFVISPSSPKYSTALHFQEHTQIKVLLPHWFDDAVRLGMGALDTTPYEWPDPPLLKGPGTGETDEGQEKQREDALKRAAMKRLDAEKKTLYRTAAVWLPGAPLPVSNPDSSSSTSPTETVAKNVWQGRRVLLSRTLELTGGRREAVEAGVTRGGGVVVSGDKGAEVDWIDECDVFVARYRSGKAYVKAVRQAKTIGTLPWVFHVQSTGILSPPMDQLLWYPVPKKPIEGFSGHEITVTNYTGESREYLKKLIVAMGATFTPSMSGKNTVLIAAYISGTKTTKAASWSIPIVNHIWLEDCFVKWRNLTVALEKYIVFPPGVDFSGMLGERGVGRAVEEVGEEELEMMENEDEEEQNQEHQSEDVNNAEESQKPVPLTTQNSARDAKEVEEFMGVGVEVDGDVDMDIGHMPDAPELVREDHPEAPDHHMDVDDEEAPSQKEDEPPTSSRPQMKSISSRLRDKEKSESTAKTRVKPRKSTASPKKRAATSSPERTPTPEIRVSKRKSGKLEVSPLKKRSRPTSPVDSETSTSDDEVEVVAVVTSPVKEASNGKRTLVKRAGEKQPSWIDDGPPSPRKKGKAKSASDEEEDVEMDVEEVVSSKAKKLAVKKASRKTPHSDEEDGDEEAEDEIIVPIKRTRTSRRRRPLSSEEEDEPMKVNRKPTATSSSKSKLKEMSPESEDDEPVKANGLKVNTASSPKSKSKPTPKKGRLESEDEGEEEDVPAKVNGRKAATLSSSKLKAKKTLESEEEDEEDEHPVKINGRMTTSALASSSKTKASSKAGRKFSDEEDNANDDSDGAIVIMSTSRSKGKGKGKGKEVARSAENARPKARPLGKIKRAAEPATETEDDDATPPPLIPKKTPAKATKLSAKAKKPNTDDDEAEAEDASPPPPPTKKTARKAQPKGNQKSTTVEPMPSAPSPVKTPARVVSVLMPQLTLTTKKSPPKAHDDALSPRLARTESIRVAAGERAVGRSSTGRPSTSTAPAASASKAKSKPKPLVAPAPSSSPGIAHEGDTSLVISGRTKRNAAAKASQKLHDEIMPDVMNYQNEMRHESKGRKSLGLGSVPGGLGKKKRSSDARADGDDEDSRESGGERETKRRRLSAPEAKKKGKMAGDDDSGEEDTESEKPSKSKAKGKKMAAELEEENSDAVVVSKKSDSKSKKGSKPEDLELSSPSKKSGSIRLMTTQVSLSEDVVKALTKLGVKMTARPAECTHLLAPHLVRTEKFLCALAVAPFILTEKWATESAAAKRLLDEGDYLLRDKTNERKYDFVLRDALSRAKDLQGGLFAKQVFYITPKVPIDIKLLKNVVIACGGQVNTQLPTLRVLNANPDRHIISCPEDVSIWRPIARSHPIYTHELILTGALKQEVDWDTEAFKVPGSQS